MTDTKKIEQQVREVSDCYPNQFVFLPNRDSKWNSKMIGIPRWEEVNNAEDIIQKVLSS